MPKANEVSDKLFTKLVAEVKKNPGNSERHYSEATGIPMNQIGKALYEAEVAADPSLKIPKTGKGVVAAVKRGTLRWPRIAAYAGITVGEAKKLYETETGESAPSNTTGRGRRFDGAPAGKKASGGKAATGGKTGTSGRRGAAAVNSGKGKAAPAGRRGTRAAADPK